MNIRKKCALAALYKGPEHPIDESYAELCLIRAACRGDEDAAAAFFGETKLFSEDPCVIDTPYRRYEGLDGIRAFAREWLGVFHAQGAEVIPVIQTRANGHSVTELQVDFIADGEIEQVPFFVVADLRTQSTLDEVRIYTHCTFVPGAPAYRAPLFKPAHYEMGDPGLLTGAVREYYEALHHVPNVDVDRVMRCTADNCKFGGYHPDDAEKSIATREDLRKAYEHMSTYIPSCVGMRYETITDDGINCVIEWVHIVSREGQERLGRLAESGIAVYERGEDGRLCAIRISDYAYMESKIEWDKMPITLEEAKKVHFVETFPAGCGNKKQS